jgi:hemoglobin
MIDIAEPAEREVLPTEAEIATLVDAFYARVRADAVLGPIFETIVQDWDHHLARMVDFWSSVMLTSGRYKGMPLPAHARHDVIGPDLFPHWLALFRQTAEEICPPAVARAFLVRAERIAASLSMGIALARGTPVERLPRFPVGARVA